MRLKLWYFINKHAILKKLFFWIFPLLGINVAKAETIYQCTACPAGLSSNPGGTSVNDCFNPVTKGGSQMFSGTTNQNGTLQPGWYRISLRGTNGSGTSLSGKCISTQLKCTSTYNCGYTCVNSGKDCSASGGAGGQTYYVFYVSATASYSYTYNSGAPKFTVTESGKTRTFSAGKGGDASSKYSGYDAKCSNGAAGASNQVSGLFSNDKSSSNVDSLGSAGAKLTKL